MVAWSRDAVAIIKQLHEQNPALYDSFGASAPASWAWWAPDGASTSTTAACARAMPTATSLFDHLDYQGYDTDDHRGSEALELHEVPLLGSLGPEAGWYKVGPLARVQNCDRIPTPLAEAERASLVAFDGGKPLHATLGYHWARMIEMLHAAETIKELLLDDDLLGTT
jgi:NAD-reducing hydrogenase large subunit